jgi:hypothetical protein
MIFLKETFFCARDAHILVQTLIFGRFRTFKETFFFARDALILVQTLIFGRFWTFKETFFAPEMRSS